MSSTVAPVRSFGIAGSMCFHFTLGKSPRKWFGAVDTPIRSMLWNQSPSSLTRREMDSRSAISGSSIGDTESGCGLRRCVDIQYLQRGEASPNREVRCHAATWDAQQRANELAYPGKNQVRVARREY